MVATWPKRNYNPMAWKPVFAPFWPEYFFLKNPTYSLTCCKSWRNPMIGSIITLMDRQNQLLRTHPWVQKLERPWQNERVREGETMRPMEGNTYTSIIIWPKMNCVGLRHPSIRSSEKKHIYEHRPFQSHWNSPLTKNQLSTFWALTEP